MKRPTPRRPALDSFGILFVILLYSSIIIGLSIELQDLRQSCQQSQQQQEEDIVPIPKGIIKRYSI